MRTEAEIHRIRRDIEKLWRAGHDLGHIAEYTWLEVDEVEKHLNEMRQSDIWDVKTPGGFYWRGGRIAPHGPRPRPRRPRRSQGS